MNSKNQMSESKLKYWLGISLVDGIGSAKFQALLERFGDPVAAWHAPELELVRLGFDRRTLKNFLQARGTLDLDRALEAVKKRGIHLIPFSSPSYPPLLKEVPSPPMLLYVAGQIDLLAAHAVAIVGTRRLTSYGRQMTSDLASGLVQQGLVVVSGLARGIDTVAHQAAIDQGGETIAVLGSGLNEIYPPENRQLAIDIARSGRGALVSEYAIDTKPQSKNFPPRNRIISGLSLGTCIVEGEVKSGAMITTKFALEQNREVFAVPGNVNNPNSSGPNYLIQQGAKLVCRTEDILEELQLPIKTSQSAVQRVLPETAEEAALLPLLSHNPLHVDEITRQSLLPTSMVSSTLTILELKGVVRHVGGMQYALM